MLNPSRSARFLGLGTATAGAVSVAECHAAGLNDRRLHWLVESGRWQTPFPRIYIAFSGPVPALTLQHAALLYAGSGSTMSHDSAGQCWRLCRDPGLVHLTVPYARQVDKQPGLVIHRSRTLSDDDVHPVFTPRRTRIERTVLDLLAGAETAAAALSLVADACRDQRCSPDTLRAALALRSRTRWRKVVLEALPDIGAGAQSTLEVRDAQLRRRHGLPVGRRQAKRLTGGVEFLDVLIEDWNVHVEIDGRLGHDRAQEIWRDMARDNRSEMARLRHLRYGWADMIDRPCEVAIQQATVLRQQGWTGRFQRCPTCPRTLPPGV
jgi:hypothetical protein